MVTLTEIKMYEDEMKRCIDWIESYYGTYTPTESDAINHRRPNLAQMLDRYAVAKQAHAVLYEQFRKESMDNKARLLR